MKKSTIPELTDLIQDHADAKLRNAFVALPGKIEAYDPAATTATISIAMKGIVNDDQNKLVDYPPLVDVPVFQLTGGSGGINMPIAAGDPCLVIFADRDIDNWYSTGSAQPPNTSRVHSISDGFAIVGFRPQTNKVDRPDYLATGIYNDQTQISVKNNKAAIKNQTTDLKTMLDSIISAVNNALSGMTITAPNGPCTKTYTFTPPTPGDLLYTGDETTPP